MTRLMFRSASLLAAASFAASVAQATPSLYTGMDNTSIPLPSHPNSQAAQTAFMAAVAGTQIAVQGYETEALGTLGAVTTGTLSNGVGVTVNNTTVGGRLEVVAPPGGVETVYSTFAATGSRFLFAISEKDSTYFTVGFNQPVKGIGFYISDVSDWAACAPSPLCTFVPPLQVVLTTQSGATLQYSLTPGQDPRTLVNGNLAFFGIVDLNDPFTSMALRSVGTPDIDAVGIDDFTVAVGTAPVPEPASALLMLGAGPVWAWARRRQRQVRAA